jgi:hypothetical protein
MKEGLRGIGLGIILIGGYGAIWYSEGWGNKKKGTWNVPWYNRLTRRVSMGGLRRPAHLPTVIVRSNCTFDSVF